MVLRTRLGLAYDVTVRPLIWRAARASSLAAFESASRTGPWGLGQNKRNFNELLRAIDENLMPAIGP